MPINGAAPQQDPEPDPGQDPISAALAAGGQAPEGAVPDDHEPTYPGDGLEPVSLDEVEQELLRGIRQAGRLAAGTSDAGAIAQAGAGAFAFVQALEKLNTPDPAPPAPPAPQEKLVVPHAVGLVRHALAQDHGVPTSTFDELLQGAHHHMNDLQTTGDPAAAAQAAAEAAQGGAEAPSGQ